MPRNKEIGLLNFLSHSEVKSGSHHAHPFKQICSHIAVRCPVSSHQTKSTFSANVQISGFPTVNPRRSLSQYPTRGSSGSTATCGTCRAPVLDTGPWNTQRQPSASSLARG